MKSYLSALVVALLVNNESKLTVEALQIEQIGAPQTIKMNLVQEGRLSDQMKNLSAKLPETKVLETKLTDMMKLQPSIQKTLIKLNHLTTMPEQPLVDAQKNQAKAAVKAIEKATDGISKKSSKKSSTSSSDDSSTGSTAADKALKKIEKISEKVEKSDKLPSITSTKSTKIDTASEIKNAIQEISDSTSDALMRMNKNVEEDSVQKLVSNRICKAGEDEVFDNCVLAEQKREWNDVDQSDIKENNKNANSKEFGDAASEMIAKVNKKIDEKLAKDEEDEEEKPKKKKKGEEIFKMEPSENAVEETVKAAEEVVEKAQEKADKVIEKVAEKKEAAPNGVIDVFARVLGDNAKVQARKDDVRSKLETAIMTRAAATDAKIETTRDSLQSGLKEADKNSIPLSQKTVDAMANLAKAQVAETAAKSLDENPMLSSMKDQGSVKTGKNDFGAGIKKGEEPSLAQK